MVCSIESGLRQNGHFSWEANLYFSSSFFVVIILCTTLKVNCLSLLSFEDLYIYSQNNHPNQEVLKSVFSKPLLWRVLKQVSRWTDCNNFYSGIWLRLLFYLLSHSTLKLLRPDQEPWKQMPFVSNPEEWRNFLTANRKKTFQRIFSYNSGCKRKLWAIFLPRVHLWKKQTPGSRLKT